MSTYRVYRCPNGHQWDVYGHISKRGNYVPEGQPRVFFCPTCDRLAVDIQGHEPERLS